MPGMLGMSRMSIGLIRGIPRAPLMASYMAGWRLMEGDMRHGAKHVGNVQNVNWVNKRHSKGTSDGKLYGRVGG